ncbi:type II secretion system protein GspL [Acinetobacter sp.]|uniref:type II secretion system protein GspL n=1 Tax=Acinetobacter sp. TaxID=472 RepID=UPI003890C4E8
MLHIWMPENDGLWHWSQDGQWSQAIALEQLIRELSVYQGQAAVVYFPSRHVQLLQQQMSKSHYKQLGAVGASYLLEEYVVLPLDAMLVKQHFVQPDQLYLMAIAKTTVETMQHALSLLPIQVQALLPDFLLVPEPEENQSQLLAFSGRLLVRESGYSGGSIDDLNVYLDYQDEAREYSCMGLHADHLQAIAASKTQAQYQLMDINFDWLKQPQRHVWNMLTPVKAQHKASGYWGLCAGLVAAVLVTQVAVDGLRWYQAKQVAEQTAQQAVEQYKAWFGAHSRVSEQNLKSQFESQLRLNQNGDTEALTLISRVAPILMQHQVVAQQLNYDEQGLNLALSAGSSQNLQQLSEQLGKQGFKVQLGNISSQGNAVLGQLSIQ